MTEPRYPSEEELLKIRKWDGMDPRGCLDFVRSLWTFPDYATVRRKRDGSQVYRFATGGWSGNEDLIAALERNLVVHAAWWQSSHKGGLHIYHVHPLKVGIRFCVNFHDLDEKGP